MAEEGCVYELEGLKAQLQSLLSRYSSDDLRSDSKPFCSDFCKLVEEYASHWQVPLPQLRILAISLCYFSQASTFTSNCDHVLHTLSSLALSVFELLLFFDQKDFHQKPLKSITITLQECHLVLARHQNVHLVQVERLVQGGGPWASPVLQAILSESSLPQNEVVDYINSELPVFFELRVRYLLSCDRVSEAIALAKCCAQHPIAGQHLFFFQIYLTWLYKTSQHDCLHKEVEDINGKYAVHIICSLECEEKDDLLLALTRAFLSQQLLRGDVYYLCDLVFIWSKLHSRLNTSKESLLEETHQLMLSVTNVNSIFPFIRAILQELGDDGIQFCVELCANALESCLPCDDVTKSLIYKTIAGLLPNDLEVCRACALLVFFLERSVEAYKMVYLLYMHPDQEYHVEYIPIGNNVRFETLQILKKDLYFDPEFWNLIALRTNCLKLMSEKVVSAALEEIMEDKWILNYCTKETGFQSGRSLCQKGKKRRLQAKAKKRPHKEDQHHNEATVTAPKRLKVGPGKTRLNTDHTLKKKGTIVSRALKEPSSEPLRRSFWQLDRMQDNVTIRYGEYRRMTRLSEKNPPKRRIRKPRWLLEDSGTLEKKNASQKIQKHKLKQQNHHQSSVIKGLETGQIGSNAKHKTSTNSHIKARDVTNKQQKELSLDCLKPATPPQVILELSLPDNELMGTFTEDSCNRQRGLPQVLFYKPTVKHPTTLQPVKTVHRNKVILRARDAAMLVQQLHCYARRQKGKGKGLDVHGSVSTITRSSVQGSPPKDPQRQQCKKPDVKVETVSRTLTRAEVAASTILVKDPRSTKAVSRKTSAARGENSENVEEAPQLPSKGKVLTTSTSARELHDHSAGKMKADTALQTPAVVEVAETQELDKIVPSRELCEEPTVEMKVIIASQTSAAAKVSQSTCFVKVCKDQSAKDITKLTNSAGVSHTTTTDNNQKMATDEIPPVYTRISKDTGTTNPMTSQSQDGKKVETGKIPPVKAPAVAPITGVHAPCVKDTNSKGKMITLSRVSQADAAYLPTDQESMNTISALTLVTEMVTGMNDKQQPLENNAAKESTARSKPKVPKKIQTTSSCTAVAPEASTITDGQLNKGRGETWDTETEMHENSEAMQALPEPEESKLEYCCTFCNKVFKGSRVVAHAMVHFRKDKCMFCGTVFKDDLLAMMHMSDHIENLKKSKEPSGNRAPENCVTGTKVISTSKTSAKDKTSDMASGRHSHERTKKSSVCLKTVNLPDSSPSESRKLRSTNKLVDGHMSQEKKQLNTLKRLHSDTHVQKVNGHIDKKKKRKHVRKQEEDGTWIEDLKTKQVATLQNERDRTSTRSKNPESGNQNREMNSTASIQVEQLGCSTEDKKKVIESLLLPKADADAAEEKNMASQDKLCCPVDGCAWFTDMSKNRVALLYHALEDHYGEVKPLELAFRVGNSRCTICMRVLWSFKHFQHHVERHRITPRHPCLHQGCTARFKTGIEMRRHTRRHSPLQAVCCLPGCSQLFICLWALNLHEREHYASKPTKSVKVTCEQTSDKHNNIAFGKNQKDHEPKDATSATVVNKTLSLKVARKLRQVRHNSSRKRVKSLSTGRNKTGHSNVSDKDTMKPAHGPILRLRKTLRKGQETNATLVSPKTHQAMSSPLFKHNSRVSQNLKRNRVKINVKGPKRRGRPPKSKEDVHDENRSTGQRSQEKAALQKNLKSHAQLQTSNNINRPINKTSASKPQKSTTDKRKMLHILEKCSTPEENINQTIASEFSKSRKHKATDSKVNKKERTKWAPKQTESIKSGKGVTAVLQVEAKPVIIESSVNGDDGKAKETYREATQNITDDPAPLLSANSSNKAIAPSTISENNLQEVTTEVESKQSPGKKKEIQKEKNVNIASSSSEQVTKKHRHINKHAVKKTVKKDQLCTDMGKKSSLKKAPKSKCVFQQHDETKAAALVQSSVDEEGKVKEEVPDATLDSSMPEPNKVNQSCQELHEDDTKVVKKIRQDQEPVKSEPGVQTLSNVETEVVERCVAEEPKRKVETPQSAITNPGYSLMNGQAAKSSVSKETLAIYSKKPYRRPPPTAYLDERYITMPKRRKDMSLFKWPQRNSPPGQACIAATVQRQRCASCFAAFNSTEDLQCHLQLQKCSNLFGFDSDDEGNG